MVNTGIRLFSYYRLIILHGIYNTTLFCVSPAHYKKPPIRQYHYWSFFCFYFFSVRKKLILFVRCQQYGCRQCLLVALD